MSRVQDTTVGRLRIQARLAGPVTQAESRLWDPAAAKVVRTIPGAVMTDALPGGWTTGRTQLLHAPLARAIGIRMIRNGRRCRNPE